MEHFDIDRLFFSRWVFQAALVSMTLIFGSGCEKRTIVSEKSWKLAGATVHEKIDHGELNWPDRVYQRTYWIVENGKTVPVGSYRNESDVGVVYQPFLLDGSIVILTSSYVFLVSADNQIKKFSPFKVGQWREYSDRAGVNGFYDYHAKTVEKKGDVWKFSYLRNDADRSHLPTSVYFTTSDDWRSFQLASIREEK
ncbi:MAG: hypothetical protein GY768_24280 [Planctomycetaceae bacterium]|nr:hypothetical protein [Planctomycetaceae bacterium]